MTTAQYWIDHLDLEQHPEGGWYREIYRSDESIRCAALPKRFCSDRCFSTAIYYLLKGNERSTLHRINQDEMWHFYDGGPLVVHQISPTGDYSSVTIGRHPEHGQQFTTVVKAGWLFAAAPKEETDYSLVGCTVSPGFEFADLEIPDRNKLIQQHGNLKSIIERLGR